jgi:O-antigen/teichoic acid export membrane protein
VDGNLTRPPTGGRRIRRIPRGPASAGNRTSGRLAERLRTIATVLSPLAVGTVLLYYFGWVRTKVQATALGYDAQILDFSTADYVLKSVNVLSIPLTIALIVSLILYQLHLRLLDADEKHRRHLSRLLSQSWLLWLPVCVALMVFVPPLGWIAIPGTLTLALLGAIYGDVLQKKVRKQKWSRCCSR